VNNFIQTTQQTKLRVELVEASYKMRKWLRKYCRVLLG